MWDQSIEKLIEVEKQPPLYLQSIENWNGLAPEEKKKLKIIVYILGSCNLHKLHTVPCV
jgi:hypothetical protein